MDDKELLINLVDDDIFKDDKETYEVCEESCPICESSDNIRHDKKNAIVVCTKCGFVLDIIMDDNPEWRHYEDNIVDTSRCSHPVSYLLPQSSLGTTIGGKGKNRLKILHSWNAMPYKERSFNVILKKIEEICVKGKISKNIEYDAKILCKQVIQGTYMHDDGKEKNIIIRGLNRNSIIAGAIFFACRRNGKTRSSKEIAAIAGIDYTNVTSGCTAFSKFAESKCSNMNLGTSQPEHFIRRYCEEFRCKKEFTNEAVRYANNIRAIRIAATHTPISVATGCILLLADIYDINITKKMIKDKINISEVTINKTYKEFQKYKKIIIDDELTKKVSYQINKNNKESNIDILKELNEIDIQMNNMRKDIQKVI